MRVLNGWMVVLAFLLATLFSTATVAQPIPRKGELDLQVRSLGGRLEFQATNRAGRSLQLDFPAGMPFVSKGKAASVVLAEDVRITVSPGAAVTVGTSVFACGPGPIQGDYQSSDDPRFERAFRVVRAARDARLGEDTEEITRLAVASTWSAPNIPEGLRERVQRVLDLDSAFYVVQGGRDEMGSAYASLCQGSPFEGGFWCSAKGDSDWVQRTFMGTHGVFEIRIGRASTDVTTEGFRLTVKLRGTDGQWVTVDEVRDTNINRTELSGGGAGRSLPSYRKRLDTQLAADAIRIEYRGHGWFDLQDVQVVAAPLLPGGK